MREGESSGTAERVAAERAAHQLIDRPLVLDDPLAVRVVHPERARKLLAEPAANDRSPIAKPMRAIVVVRSRIAEDELRERHRQGVNQYILLGAGFDTFAYRNPFPSVRVFEVDFPSTQTVKRRRIADAGIAVPANVTYVPMDFDKDRLEPALAAAGFNRREPAVFAWLGVAMYLEERDIDATLTVIGAMPERTSLVFDYAQPPDTLPWLARILYRRVLSRLAERGEPWRSFFEPDPLRDKLLSMGFTAVEDLGADEINARYLANRSDGLRSGGVGRIAIARK